jgi:hypothetical protein
MSTAMDFAVEKFIADLFPPAIFFFLLSACLKKVF